MTHRARVGREENQTRSIIVSDIPGEWRFLGPQVNCRALSPAKER